MSPLTSKPEHSFRAGDYPTPSGSSQATVKSRRVLACVLCQQRKVKCDRKFPCANCVKAGAECKPATLIPRKRRRRFPERNLLDRLHHYEGLLRQNHIEFEPLHTPIADKLSPNVEDSGVGHRGETHARELNAGGDEWSGGTKTGEAAYEARNIWHAMIPKSSNLDDDDDDEAEDECEIDSLPDDLRETSIQRALDQLYESNDCLLFGPQGGNIDLSPLHPDQVQIFRLWQIYLDNINPLLKITHTPTLQARIVDAAADITSINPVLEALLFSIYSVSVLSLVDDECYTHFGLSRKDLLTNYRFACRQALLNCGFLRSADRDCLTALYLYLISVRPDTDPRSLSSMLGVAVRIAQRMEIHNEFANVKYPALEAEMRRRLWWSLIIFDARIADMSDYKATLLGPTWNCRTLLNVNDFDLRPEMKTLPIANESLTEAIFAVVRSEMSEYVRHCTFHLDFINPALKSLARNVRLGPIPEDGELGALEKLLEDRYLKFCNPENPLHCMTLWTARGYLAKLRLIEHYWRILEPPMRQTSEQREDSISQALTMLECDTMLMTSPHTKGYLWLINLHFPLPAYIHLLQDLGRQPISGEAGKVWEYMSANYKARFMHEKKDDHPVSKIISKMVLHTWEARVEISKHANVQEIPPLIVSDIQRNRTQISPNTEATNSTMLPTGATDTNSGNFPMFVPSDYNDPSQMNSIEGGGTTDWSLWTFPGISSQGGMGVNVNQFNWTPMDWNLMHRYGW